MLLTDKHNVTLIHLGNNTKIMEAIKEFVYSTQDVNCRGNTAMAKDERKIRRTRSERGLQKEDLLDHGVTHQLLLQK
jgi:hypothetical protein